MATCCIFTIAILSWLILGGVPISAYCIGFVFIFCIGIVSWASVCRLFWPSQCSLNAYLPFGYLLGSLASFILIMLKQGTVVSCLIGSLSGAILLGLKTAVCAQQRHSIAGESIQTGITRGSTSLLVITGLASTFLLTDQLRSILDLRDFTVNTTINGWSDVILHANTVLSLSSLAPGQAPISTLYYTDQIIPYHYASYILSSLVSSLSVQASPMASYVSIVAPLGCMLLMLPLLEDALTTRSKHTIFGYMATGSLLFLIYSLWTRLINNSFFDPAWLLITGPATIYACAIVISGLQIGTKAYSKKSISRVSLVLMAFLLTAFSKIQIAHSLLAMVVIILTSATLDIKKQKMGIAFKHWLFVFLMVVSFSAVHLYGNWKLDIGRKHPVAEVTSFLSGIGTTTWGNAHFGQGLPLNNAWIAPLLGLLTLWGPLLLIALITSNARQSRDNFRPLVLTLMTMSYTLSLILSPSMPWDDGEFLNRSWPLLWCLGAWYLLGQYPIRLEQQLNRQMLIIGSVIATILGWFILPEPKRESIASPPIRGGWMKAFYPTTIRLSEKKLAARLGESKKNTYFFASSNSKNTNYLLDDLPSRLAALNGMRPLLSRLSFQKSLSVHRSNNSVGQSIEKRYSLMLKRYAGACTTSSSANSPIKAFKQPESAPDQQLYIVCQSLEQPSQ